MIFYVDFSANLQKQTIRLQQQVIFFGQVIILRNLFPSLSFPLFQLSHRAGHHLFKLVGGYAQRFADLFRQQPVDELQLSHDKIDTDGEL